MKRFPFGTLLFFLFLVCTCTRLSSVICRQAAAVSLLYFEPESESFRRMQLSGRILPELSSLRQDTGMPTGELLTILCALDGTVFSRLPSSMEPEDYVRCKRMLITASRTGYEQVREMYGAVWDDVACFPTELEMDYENTWMFERNYGGTRGHEGCDLMPPENLPGHYRILSMTDGVVEKIGWLPKGGYRIGIRSSHGGYFYYAHLDSYSRSYQIGDEVMAGETLGLMGDSGYGPEGTTGKFDVHLHLGIYIRTENTEELSVNPYWVLRWLEAY